MDEKLILEVSQITSYIKEMMDGDGLLTGLCIRGELSNYKTYPSGHHYFTLKDSKSSLSCVMFRSNALRLRFRPENGMTVVAAGRITVYERDGKYQLYCVSMSPEGAGDLAVAFEQLKKKLFNEGLFDESHKKPIPRFPHRIALITSSAGAALHDMLRILAHRYPLAEIKLLPVRVQGEEAPSEIAAALDFANRYRVADLIITGRGGGSMEDLWAFNEEIVARAIYRSEIPVISAVGHEPDVTISDYVADLRAATPSNGAELATPDQADLRISLKHLESIMAQSLGKRLKLAKQQLELRRSSRVLRSPMEYLENRRIQLDSATELLARSMTYLIMRYRTELLRRLEQVPGAWQNVFYSQQKNVSTLAARLDAMSPLKVLSRGYSVTVHEDGHVVRNAKELLEGENIRIRFCSGTVNAIVNEIVEE